MRIYWLNHFAMGNIGMMARPRGNDWLEDEVKSLCFCNVDMVVSLLERSEEIELEIESEKSLCEKEGITFISFPIEDRKIPDSFSRFSELISTIVTALDEGRKIVIHCRMGIGRTSLVVAAILLRKGVEFESVFELIGEKRTLTVPDTKEQVNWLKSYAEKGDY